MKEIIEQHVRSISRNVKPIPWVVVAMVDEVFSVQTRPINLAILRIRRRKKT